jgi:steroid delta-isomerase-like uncharacterized protein
MKKLLMILPLALILCFTVGCQDKEAMAELEEFRAQAQVEEQNKELARNVHLAWEQRDYDLIRASCAPDLAFYSPSSTKFESDLEQGIEFADSIYSGISDYDISIEDIMAEGDKVAIRAILRGTHTGDVFGLPATGNKIEQSQILIFRFENGKIVEIWEDYDSIGFMQQLGMELKPKEGGEVAGPFVIKNKGCCSIF